MATLEKIVSIIFQGEDKVGPAADSVKGRIVSLTGAAESVIGPLADLGDSVLKIDAALAALAVGGIAVAINEAGKFGDSFNEISTMIHATEGEIAAFKTEILDYGRTSVKSYQDINSAVYTAISAGADYKDSLALLSTAEKLSVAGKADLEATMRLLLGTLNAYGAGTDDATKYSDIFFKTVEKGQTTIPELANSLAQVTGIAAGAGVPIETLTAAIAALTASGAPTTQAITGIKAAISNIIKPSSEAQEASKELGIQFNAEALASKGLEGVLKDVQQATGGNVEQMGRLFGSVEGLNTALVLGSDTSGKFADALKEIRDSGGATEAAYKKMAENFELINQNLANNVKATLIQMGTEIQDDYINVVGEVTNIFKAIGQAVDAGSFDPLFREVEKFAAKLQAMFADIAENLPEALEQVDWSKFLRALEGLGDEVMEALEALFGPIDLSTPEGLAAAIQKIIDGITYLTNVTSGMVQAWKPWLEGLGATIDKFLSWSDGAQKASGYTLGLAQAIEKAIGFVSGFAGALDGIKIALYAIAGTSAANTITTLGTAAVSALGGMGGLAASVATVAGTAGLAGLAAAAGYGAGVLIDKYVPAVGDVVDSIVDWIDNITDFSGEQEKQNELAEDAAWVNEKLASSLAKQKDAYDHTRSGMVDFGDTLGDVMDEMVDFGEDLDEMAEPRTVAVTVQPDRSSIEKTYGVIMETLPDGEIIARMDATVAPNKDSIEKTKKAIETEIPSEKVLEIQAQLITTGIKEASAIIQSSIEWEAKLKIAEVEAGTAKMKAMFESVNVAIESTGETLSDLTGLLKGTGGQYEYFDILEQVEKESQRRDEALALQRKLVEVQIKEIEERTRKMERGEALIKVTGDGLQPHLEAFMWEIMKAIQVRVNAEGGDYLIGAGK